LAQNALSKMKKLAVIIGTVLAGGIVLFFILPRPQPTYHGRAITAWMDDWAAKKSLELPEAIRQIGTNALPYVVHNLALNDSAWRSNYARLQAKLPRQLQIFFRKPKPLLQEVDGANVFFYIGSNSIPDAMALMKHHSPTVRRSAAWGISALRRQSRAANQAIPALIEALSDSDRMVRFDAALSLVEMGPDASNAVPALGKVVAYSGVGPQKNELFYVRAIAARALGKIGPVASNALPALKAALVEPSPYLRGVAAVAIWRIDSDVDMTLPVLLREMPVTAEDSKWDWIIALGEMGPRAKAAVPQLTNELRDQNNWVREYVTNALRRIDPEAAAEAGIRRDESVPDKSSSQ
jgi:hypothetical protein